jgi:hypothetical protein
MRHKIIILTVTGDKNKISTFIVVVIVAYVK